MIQNKADCDLDNFVIFLSNTTYRGLSSVSNRCILSVICTDSPRKKSHGISFIVEKHRLDKMNCVLFLPVQCHKATLYYPIELIKNYDYKRSKFIGGDERGLDREIKATRLFEYLVSDIREQLPQKDPSFTEELISHPIKNPIPIDPKTYKVIIEFDPDANPQKAESKEEAPSERNRLFSTINNASGGGKPKEEDSEETENNNIYDSW